MYVKDAMTVNPKCIKREDKISEALDLMHTNEFHRLPVVDDENKLVGLVTEGIITDGSGNKATSLSIFELNYLLSKTPVKEIMIKNVETVKEDDFLEKAAATMRKNNIGCLPVVDDSNKVTGIVTDNDIFDCFTNLLGYGIEGTKYIIRVEKDKVGVIEGIARVFKEKGVSIVTISTYYGKDGISIIVIAKTREFEEMMKDLMNAEFDVRYAGLQN